MLTKNEFIKKLKEARASQLLIERRIQEIFQNYNLEAIPFSADNSSNLDEAIQGYIHYGEMPISGNLDDLWKSYKKYIQEKEQQND
ncbi:hypothetical protein ACYKL6_03990 [Streptococcus suis]